MKTDRTAVLFCAFALIVGVVCADFDPTPVEYEDDPKIVSRDVKCKVCAATILEMQTAIKKEDPRKRVEVSGFHMNQVAKSVQLIKSETYLTELMETICKKMDDYAKARYKDTRKLTVIKMMDERGMNPDMSIVDFVYDGDLNKSLEHFCLEVLEDHEETFLKVFMEEEQPSNIARIICTEKAQYCDPPAEDHDEL